MKKNILKYACIALLPLLNINSSCNDDEIIIDRFDDTYTPEKPIKGKKDTPPPVNLLDTYTFFTNFSNSQRVKKRVIKNETRIEGLENLSLDLYLNKKAEKELNYSLAVDQDWLTEKGVKPLPEEVYELIYPNKFEIGKDKNQISINFKKELFKNLEDGDYALPLKPVFEDSEVKYLTGNDKFVAELSIYTQKLPQGNNIDNNDTKTKIDGVYSNSDIVFSSNNSNNLDKLKDGVLNRNYWYPGEGDVLTAKIEKTKKLLGVKIVTEFIAFEYYKRYSFKQVKVEAANQNDEYIEQGVFIDSAYDGENVYIKFIEPIEIDRLRFSDFLSHSNTKGMMIYELEFIYAE